MSVKSKAEARPPKRIGKGIFPFWMNQIKTATFEEFLEIFGLVKPPLRGLVLSVLKVRQPGNKHYRLIWDFRKYSVFAAECPDEFKRKSDLRKSGRALAVEKEVDFQS